MLGFAIGETGLYEPYDGPGLASAQLAVDEINAAGGVLGRKLEIIVADNKSDPTQSANAGIEVLDKGADVVVASCDYDLGGPAASEAQKRGKMGWSTCAGTTLWGPTGVGPFAFTQGMAALVEGAVMAEFAVDRGWDTAYVLHDTTTTYTNQLCDGFIQHYRKVAGEDALLGVDTLKSSDETFQPQVSRLRSVSPQPKAIFVCMAGPPPEAKLMRQVRDAGLDQPMLTGQSMDGDYWSDSLPDLDDMYHTAHVSLFGDDPEPKVTKLLKQIEEETGSPMATSHGISGYLVVEAFADAVTEAGSFDPAAVTATLEGWKKHDSLLGTVTFTPERHLNYDREVRIMQVQDGKTTLVETRSIQNPADVPAPSD